MYTTVHLSCVDMLLCVQRLEYTSLSCDLAGFGLYMGIRLVVVVVVLAVKGLPVT